MEAVKFDKVMQAQAALFATDHLFILMGEDFAYMDAFQNYENMDSLIEYMNANWADKYTLKYSTPSEYVDTIHALNHTWPTKYDDMFPYSDTPDEYWTGYFTSRANAKSEVRRGSSAQHASNKLYSDAIIDQAVVSDPVATQTILAAKDTMMDAMAVYQHHDAVSGTARQPVADDYSFRLQNATNTMAPLYAWTLSEKGAKMAGIYPGSDPDDQQEWQ